MKVLYVGYYREKSDWGKQTVNNILALEKAGVDVVCRSIELGHTQTPEAIAHLEDKDIGDATHCIQHVFPEHMVGTGKFEKNIGFLGNNFFELEHSVWVERLDMMDEVWVPSDTAYSAFSYKCKDKVKYVPLAIDTAVHNKRYKELAIKEAENTFKFYTFASTSDAQGLDWILASFHSEFDVNDNVSLVIYMKPQSSDSQRELKFVDDLSENIKSLLRLETSPELYNREIVISAPDLTDENLYELHQYCNCYVSCNTGVTFPLAEIDAAGFGNTPIISDKNSVREYLRGSANAVNSIHQVVQSKGGIFGGVNNGNDYWIKPDERNIKRTMRMMYNLWCDDKFLKDTEFIPEAREQLSHFSLETVGEKMKEALSV
jgi:glycosyltransferase involved in cell wall biosynthesis